MENVKLNTSGGAVFSMIQHNISTVFPRPISSAKIPPLNGDPSHFTTKTKYHKNRLTYN